MKPKYLSRSAAELWCDVCDRFRAPTQSRSDHEATQAHRTEARVADLDNRLKETLDIMRARAQY